MVNFCVCTAAQHSISAAPFFCAWLVSATPHDSLQITFSLPSIPGASCHCRVASIFVILFGASVFGLLTLRFKSADAVFPRLLRAFSGGIILALALVHIIPEVRHAAALPCNQWVPCKQHFFLQAMAFLQAVRVFIKCWFANTRLSTSRTHTPPSRC
jgi:hypothetical protein